MPIAAAACGRGLGDAVLMLMSSQTAGTLVIMMQ
jgi:hypothetical protein